MCVQPNNKCTIFRRRMPWKRKKELAQEGPGEETPLKVMNEGLKVEMHNISILIGYCIDIGILILYRTQKLEY